MVSYRLLYLYVCKKTLLLVLHTMTIKRPVKLVSLLYSMLYLLKHLREHLILLLHVICFLPLKPSYATFINSVKLECPTLVMCSPGKQLTLLLMWVVFYLKVFIQWSLKFRKWYELSPLAPKLYTSVFKRPSLVAFLCYSFVCLMPSDHDYYKTREIRDACHHQVYI